MLERNGIKTALDLRDADDEWVRTRMTVVGLRTVQELRFGSRTPLGFRILSTIFYSLLLSNSPAGAHKKWKVASAPISSR
jgi:hypothetical protein